jgi:peptidyl-tRNA hydrolase, PTH1 family
MLLGSASVTRLVVGLGNPGSQYAQNRHNIGFMVCDRLAGPIGGWREKFNGVWTRGMIGGHDTLLLKPMTYMNRSGTSVGAAATFFKVSPAEVIVIHDELDIAYGEVRVKVGGGHAGHNGLRSIFEHFGKDFIRIRCGIGRPVHGEVADFVLSDFKGEEKIALDDFLGDAAAAVEQVLRDGPETTMNQVNQKKSRTSAR